ncbi:MAG: hypothetical protein RIR79_943 [Pseudomonadota bacterium]|jgi:guanylate kinase
MDYQGNLFVIAAPSGAGKSSLVRALMELDAQIQPTVSHTTRSPRGQEQQGREYFFVSNDAFDAMIAAGDFVEWANVHSNRYGTSKHAIQERMAQGVDVILEIDYQGALQIKKVFPHAMGIFILPPSWEELRTRIERRGEDKPEVIAVRMKNAATEVAHVNQFDFVIINEFFDRALFDLKTIIHAQRLKFPIQRRLKASVFEALFTPPSFSI